LEIFFRSFVTVVGGELIVELEAGSGGVCGWDASEASSLSPLL
jgi:hypothetical protein